MLSLAFVFSVNAGFLGEITTGVVANAITKSPPASGLQAAKDRRKAVNKSLRKMHQYINYSDYWPIYAAYLENQLRKEGIMTLITY